jgi:polyisoprenoid-binding protein YceI
MRKLLLAAALSFAVLTPLSAPAFAQVKAAPADSPSGTYKLDLSHASVVWRVSHLGLSMYTGRFADFDAELVWNGENPSASTVTATINAASIKTEYPNAATKDFDKVLATGDKWFNAGAHPTITFTTTSADIGDGKTGTVSGNLTFLGVTKPVTLDVTFNGGMLNMFSQKWALGFSGKTTLTRSDFGMANLVPNIGDEVEVIIEAEFQRAG